MADAYLQIDGVKGSSTDHEHKDWIDISSYRHNFHQPINNAEAGSTGRRAEGRAQWDDLVITKQQDLSSPDLAHLCAAGNFIKKVEIKLLAAGASGKDKRNNYMKIILEGVYISKYESRMEKGSSRPIEDIHLNFGKIKWQFTPDRDGKGEAPIIKGWNRDENKDNS